ncbi:hypothetical protein [Clostridium thermobutyricum]|uniref:Phage abortive infection protein n=1 Tax=Clostridium thermobutyricum DSM 4928 TaxID=1121339 RepID=A0A1V4SYX9_9CLOT|nr:hypothetical protein [Clostridium thermobutyricum]OPX49144.1 hypothetical protein CLTHE_08980 [Clostridium thermobutyricum DSM 4928]
MIVSKENKIAIIFIVMFIIALITGLIFIHYFYGNYFQYSDWIKLVITSLISVVGILGTFITILITINSINDSKKNISLRKRKLAIILEYEINNFLVSFFNEFYRFLEYWDSHNFEELEKPTFFKENLNMLSLDFKNMLYELIDIDSNKESLEIFEFFKIYENCIQTSNKFAEDQEKVYAINSFIEVFGFAFNEDYLKYANLSSFRTRGIAHNYLPINEKEKEQLKIFYNNKIKIYKKDNLNKLLRKEYSKKMISIFKYLDSLKG